jgi:hypothetical protein
LVIPEVSWQMLVAERNQTVDRKWIANRKKTVDHEGTVRHKQMPLGPGVMISGRSGSSAPMD